VTLRLKTFILAAALAMAGCTAVDLSGYQDSYHTLLAAKQSGSDAAVRTKSGVLGRYGAGSVLRTDPDQGLLDLSRQSIAAAAKAKNQESRIALHFLAASAAWQSDAPDADRQAILAADAGATLCRDFPADRFKPARDCAVLGTLHIIVAGEAILRTIRAHITGRPEQRVLDLANWNAVDEGSKQFRLNVLARFGDIDRHIAAIRGVDSTVVQWHGAAKRRLWCQYWITVSSTVDDWRTGGAPDIVAAKQKLVATSNDLRGLAAANLSFEPNAAFSYCQGL